MSAALARETGGSRGRRPDILFNLKSYLPKSCRRTRSHKVLCKQSWARGALAADLQHECHGNAMAWAGAGGVLILKGPIRLWHAPLKRGTCSSGLLGVLLLEVSTACAFCKESVLVLVNAFLDKTKSKIDWKYDPPGAKLKYSFPWLVLPPRSCAAQPPVPPNFNVEKLLSFFCSPPGCPQHHATTLKSGGPGGKAGPGKLYLSFAPCWSLLRAATFSHKTLAGDLS